MAARPPLPRPTGPPAHPAAPEAPPTSHHVARLQWLCRQPSIAAQNVGIPETARMVAQLMEEVGVRPELHATDGAPVVYGTVGHGAPTLLIYNHYDVPDPAPLERVG